jgi:hypothetical protein
MIINIPNEQEINRKTYCLYDISYGLEYKLDYLEIAAITNMRTFVRHIKKHNNSDMTTIGIGYYMSIKTLLKYISAVYCKDNYRLGLKLYIRDQQAQDIRILYKKIDNITDDEEIKGVNCSKSEKRSAMKDLKNIKQIMRIQQVLTAYLSNYRDKAYTKGDMERLETDPAGDQRHRAEAMKDCVSPVEYKIERLCSFRLVTNPKALKVAEHLALKGNSRRVKRLYAGQNLFTCASGLREEDDGAYSSMCHFRKYDYYADYTLIESVRPIKNTNTRVCYFTGGAVKTLTRGYIDDNTLTLMGEIYNIKE